MCRYCAGQGVFTPPPHTYTHSDFVVGAWYRHLLLAFRNNFEYFDQSLASALTGKYSGLKDCEMTADLIHYKRGYQILYTMASRAGHPAIAMMPSSPQVPMQTNKQSLHEYLQEY